MLPGFASKGGSPGGFRCSGADGKGIPTTFKHRKIWRNSHLVTSTLLTAELPCWDCWRSPSPTSCSGRISFGAVHARQERR